MQLARQVRLFAALCALLAAAAAAGAQPVFVETAADETTANGACSLREAFENANAGAEVHGDCAFDPSVYTNEAGVTIVLTQQVVVSRPLHLTALLPVRVEGRTLSAGISGGNASRVLTVFDVNTPLTLTNLTVSDGRNADGFFGACVTNRGELLARDVRFVNCRSNTSTSGNRTAGALFARRGSRTELLRCVFERNFGYTYGVLNRTVVPGVDGYTSRIAGGAVMADQDTLVHRVDECVFEENDGDSGGALHLASAGPHRMRNCTFRRNTARFLGGALFVAGAVELDGGELADNDAGLSGGGVYASGDVRVEGDRVVLQRNRAVRGHGGGIYSDGSVFVRGFSRTAIANNSAEQRGGAVFAAAQLTLEDMRVDVEWNTAGHGGAFYASEGAHIDRFAGAITGNVAANDSGGFLATGPSTSVLRDVLSNATLNSASAFGAVMYFNGDVHIDNATLHVERNAARAGAIASNASMLITALRGDWIANTARLSGAVLYSRDRIFLRDYVGAVEGNVAERGDGGVLWAKGDVDLRNWTAVVRNNRADAGSGGFAGAEVDDDDSEFSLVYSNVTFSGNSAAEHGGVLAHFSSVSLVNVHGDIVNNTAEGGFGGFAGYCDFAQMVRVRGNVSHNRALLAGGVVQGRVISWLESAGSITNNTAGVGGFAAANDSVVVLDVVGDIEYNRAEGSGGVLFSDGDAELARIAGRVVHNVAEQGSGGVARGRGAVEVRDVLGDVAYNSAADGGGVARARLDALLVRIGGNLTHNTAGYGGCAAGNDSAVIDVAGDVAHNAALDGSGGVLFAITTARLYDVGGDLAWNSARGGSGGVAWANKTAYLERIVGAVVHNNASEDGGVAFGGQRVRLRSVGASVCNNTAEGRGGAFASPHNVTRSGSVFVLDVAGDVCFNRAGERGGFAHARSAIHFQNIAGDVYGNRAGDVGGVLHSRYFVAVDNVGSVYDNAADFGGAFAADERAEVTRVRGSVFSNTAGVHGGAVYSLGTALLRGVAGGVFANSADGFGGVVWALQSAELSAIGLEFNRTLAQLDNTTLLFAPNSTLRAHNDTRAIFDNAAENGGVVWVNGSLVLTSISGDISHNTADESGGVAWARSTAVHAVNGSIEWNRARSGSGGAFYVFDGFSGASIRMEDVNGDVQHNWAAVHGGAVDSDGSVTIVHLGGSIFNNTAAAGDGGAVRADGALEMAYVDGSVLHNTAGGNGGAFFSTNGGSLRSVGDLRGNAALAGSGGVWAVNGTEGSGATDLVLSLVRGNISENTAPNGLGGVAFHEAGVCVLVDFDGGEIRENVAVGGGVLWCEDGVSMLDLHRADIVRNAATGAHGGVAAAPFGAVVAEAFGVVRNNSAALNGGAFYADRQVELTDGGALFENTAVFHGGAVFAGTGKLTVRGLSFGMLGNVAGGDGGALCARNGSVVVSDVHGGMARNAAGGNGGVAFSGSEVLMIECSGGISENSADANGGAVGAVESVHLEHILGGVANNSAVGEGGAVFSRNGTVNLHRMPGAFAGNTAGSGGVISSADTCTLVRVGPLVDNRATAGSGGVIFVSAQREREANNEVTIAFVEGDVANNTASDNGGVVASLLNPAAIKNVAGVVAGNNAGADGGVVWTNRSVSISEVRDGLVGNSAIGSGGVACSRGSNVEINNSGDVRGNTAGAVGGVAFAEENAGLSNIDGSVDGNVATAGGVLYSAAGGARLTNVMVDVRENVASGAGGGGVVHALLGTCSIHRVGGEIVGNRAESGDGGVANCLAVTIGNVQQIGDNAADGNGGVASAVFDAVIANVDVAICGNSATLGGVAYSGQGDVVVASQSVTITHNSGTGSVGYGDNAAAVVAIYSGVGFEAANGNPLAGGSATADVNVVSVGGGFGIQMETQPSSVAAGDVMDPPPSVVVPQLSGDEVVRAYPVSITVNPSGGPSFPFSDLGIPLERYYLPNGEAVFTDIRLPSGSYTLTFELFGGCDVSVASVTSSSFTVSECETPGIVECPASEIITVAPTGTCTAAVHIPAPLVDPLCDTATISNNVNDDVGTGGLDHVFAVGQNEVVITVSGSEREVDCIVTVQVEDADPADIECPSAVVVTSDSGQCSAQVALPPATASDNCPVELVNSFNGVGSDASGRYRVGDTVVTFAAHSPLGFAPIAPECNTVVTVVDDEPPQVETCPDDIVIGCIGDPHFFEPTFSDNCAFTVSQLAGGCDDSSDGVDDEDNFCDNFFGSVYHQVYVATDVGGNQARCEFNITRVGTFYADMDGDGLGDPDNELGEFVCDRAPPGSVLNSRDCDDSSADRFKLWHLDADGDGYGSDTNTICSDRNPPLISDFGQRSLGRVTVREAGGDCDDNNPFIHPGAVEICDGKDNNCDGRVDDVNC